MRNQTYVNLSRGEGVVAEIASRIYSAMIQSGRVGEGQEKRAMEISVSQALYLVQYTDHCVSDADEQGKTLTR